MRCPGCGTDTVVAPGIGPYCPNMKCDRIDNLQTMMGGAGLALGLWRQAQMTVFIDYTGPWCSPACYSCKCGAVGREYRRIIDKAWEDFTTQQVLDVAYGRWTK